MRGDIKSIYPELALYGSKNEGARTDTVFFPISQVYTRGVTLTALKPDITIWDKNSEMFHIYELTCPLEENMAQRNLDKSNKKAHFVADISGAKTLVKVFEVSSRGYLCPNCANLISNSPRSKRTYHL